MREKILIIFLLLAVVSSPVTAIEPADATAFAGPDMRLSGAEVINYQLAGGEHVLVFENGFSMSIGSNRYSSQKAVAWIDSQVTEYRGRGQVDYSAKVYLLGDINSEKGLTAKTVDILETEVDSGQGQVLRFRVGGGVYVSAEKRQASDPRGMELYERAKEKVKLTEPKPRFLVQREALVPRWQEQRGLAVIPPEMEATIEAGKPGEKYVEAPSGPRASGDGFIESAIKDEELNGPVETGPEFRYPPTLSPATDRPLDIERTKIDEDSYVVTVTERFYIWQKQDEKGGLLELQGDNAVIFYSGADPNRMAGSEIESIYLSGDIIATQGTRVIRADEMYYNFLEKSGVAINAEMCDFDEKRGIPLYVRAARLQQLSEGKFAAEKVLVTSDEFYRPQVSATASRIIVTDRSTLEAQVGAAKSGNDYQLEMYDFRMKAGKHTVFKWPYIKSGMALPDWPIKTARISSDSSFGTSLETRWYLSRLLGLQEPEGVESTLAVDYFGNRGPGLGADIQYYKEDYFGDLKTYIIHDDGEDDLGRSEFRRNQDPPRELRGRFSWQHRQFLPYDWQLTTGFGYLSDENFIEGYFRNEFNVGTNETYVHLKRIQDNWAVSILGKGRINDFQDVLEELPTVQHHLAGQSLFGDEFTLYSDTMLGRLRQRIGDNHNINMSQEMFTFMSHRTELDMPLQWGPIKFVPFLAGTFGYDDRSGFRTSLVDGNRTGPYGESDVWIAESGLRASTQFWKVYPDVKSRLWDLDQLRHIITPEMTIVGFAESDSVVDQRDSFNIGLRQRLQTKRGQGDEKRTVDWMRLDMDMTWVENPADASTGPDNYIWSNPIVPLHVIATPDILNENLRADLRRFQMYGLRRDTFTADYIWRLSDTTAILSDMNFDIKSGVVQQFNVGVSRLVWPNLSYYIGSRYLRRVNVLDEFGSNAVTFAMTYVLDPRYTLVFSQQYDFDYGKSIRSDLTLIRKYHRLVYGLSLAVDESIDSSAIMLSVWPQGVGELAIGSRNYIDVGGAGY